VSEVSRLVFDDSSKRKRKRVRARVEALMSSFSQMVNLWVLAIGVPPTSQADDEHPNPPLTIQDRP
jgi:hypothetical protein